MGTISLFYALSVLFFLLGGALIAAGTILLIREKRSAPPPQEDFRFVLVEETILVHSDEIIPI